MWRRILGETVAVGALFRALLLALMAFGFTITNEQMAAVMLVAELALALFTRASVTPMSTLPPGVAGEIADNKAAAAAERSAPVPPR
jgi:hypothetical protein